MLRRAATLVLLLAASAFAADAKGPERFKNLKFRPIGPSHGGRVCRVAGVPGDPLTYYAAAAASGIWKTTDGGIRWSCLTDDVNTSTFGSLAVAPSDANVIYAGSGEANIRGNVEAGNGIHVSTDAGKSWKHVWEQEGQIGQIAVHPKNADTAFAAVLGKAFGPNGERGVFRTLNGGKTWRRVLFKDADTGASAVVIDQTNPRVVWAGLWQTRRSPWDMTSGGPGSGLYVSRDGGECWTRLIPEEEGKEAPKDAKHAKGLPKGVWGRVGIAVAPSDGKRVYALIEAEEGGLFRSDDGGETWDRVNKQKALRVRPWYFSTLTVHPTSPDTVYFPQLAVLRSTDGGKTLQNVKIAYHGDNHDVWIDPTRPERMIVGNDGGVNLTSDGGKHWHAPALPLCQFYRIHVDNRTPYRVAGTIQDIGTAQGPSNSLMSSGITQGMWYGVGGGEAGHISSDPKDPNVVYATEYSGQVTRYDHKTRHARPVSIYPFTGSGHGAEALKYRFQWTSPVLCSVHEPGVVWHAANVLFQTSDGGQKWKAVSGDLTRNDKSKMKWSGGPITGDNTGVEVFGTIFALAESPLKKGLLWAGSDDGLVHVTSDGGKSWADVTPKEGLPKWATVMCIEPSPFDAETAYLVAENHRLDDRKPYLFVTTDRGKTWKPLAEKLDGSGWLCAVREDPKKKGQLYLGAESGLYLSADAGATWERLKLNLPRVRVSDLRVKDDDLVVGTNGRGIWIMDDLTPLREWKKDMPPVALLPVRAAIRWRQGDVADPLPAMGTFDNPPAGAVLHYSLKDAVKGDVTIDILDARGKVVRALSSKEEEKDDDALEPSWSQRKAPDPLPKAAGLHRVVWDLRHEGARVIPGAKVDGGSPRTGPFVAPGVYTVRLKAGDTVRTVKVEVKPDPRIDAAAVAGLAEQERLALRIRDDIGRLSDAVIKLRSVKAQIEAREKLLGKEAKAAGLLKEGKALVKKLDGLEARLHNPKAEVSYDILAMKGGAKLYSQLAGLHEVAKAADGPPPQGLKDQHEEQSSELARLLADWGDLVETDIKALNDAAKKIDVPGVVVR